MTYADHHTIRPRVMTDADHRLADLLRRHPNGLTKSEIARKLAIHRDAIDRALNHLERRGVLLCETAASSASTSPEGEP